MRAAVLISLVAPPDGLCGPVARIESRRNPMFDQERVHDEVRAHYAAAARLVASAESNEEVNASCCAVGQPTDVWGEILYSPDDRAGLPDAARLASLGCGNPIAVAELKPGERVLDLGSGGGIDVILSAQRVGPTGRAIG